jgi:hypothetical protein
LRKPHSADDLIAAIQAAEDDLKIKKLTLWSPWSPGLEFYEWSLKRGHRHEAAAGCDRSAPSGYSKGYWVEDHRPEAGQKESARKLTYIEPVPNTPFSVGAGIYDDQLTITVVEEASGQ